MPKYGTGKDKKKKTNSIFIIKRHFFLLHNLVETETGCAMRRVQHSGWDPARDRALLGQPTPTFLGHFRTSHPVTLSWGYAWQHWWQTRLLPPWPWGDKRRQRRESNMEQLLSHSISRGKTIFALRWLEAELLTQSLPDTGHGVYIAQNNPKKGALASGGDKEACWARTSYKESLKNLMAKIWPTLLTCKLLYFPNSWNSFFFFFKLSSTATYKSLVTKAHCIFFHRALGALPGCTSFRKTRVEGNGAGGSH